MGTLASARFTDYFRELADIIERTGGTPCRDDWAELYRRYDTTFVEDA